MKFNSTAFGCLWAFIIFLFITPSTAIAELERRFLNPPKLSYSHLGKHITCYRPMRHGSPAINIKKQDSKIIINNYGHGGSGWTLAPGTAKYSLSLLKNNVNSQELNSETPIAIIGAGVIGLFTAFELKAQGYNNITIYATNFKRLTSHKAGGLIAPVSLDVDDELQPIIDKICIEAYKFYYDIAKNLNTQFKDGARIMPAYFNTREESDLEPYVDVVISPAKDVIVDFKNGTSHQMVVYDEGIFVETENLMHSLDQILKQNGVKFIKRNIKHFSQLKQPIIFNCTGLAAKKLISDEKLIPVQGHLIMLKEQNPKDINYMMLVYFDKDTNKHKQNLTRSFYIFPKKALNSNPKDIGVIGGTFIENATNSTPNSEEFYIMLEGAKKFYGIKE